MTHQPDDTTASAAGVLRAVWSAEGQTSADLDEACGRHQKTCKNMKHVSFDGMAEPGSDLRAAWREKLAREGKLGPAGSSVRDLVFGRTQDS
jgi:hypothetical protein